MGCKQRDEAARHLAAVRQLLSASPTMETRDRESNLYACEMTPNPCTQGGGAVVDNGPSSGGEVPNIYIAYMYRLWPDSQWIINIKFYDESNATIKEFREIWIILAPHVLELSTAFTMTLRIIVTEL